MAVSDDLSTLERRMERGDDAVQQNLTEHIATTRQIAKDDIINTRKELELAFENHKTIHEVVDNNLAEFKLYVRDQIAAILRALDTTREDRARFLSRETYDTAHETVEKSIIVLEKSLIEKHELALKQLSEGMNAKIQLQADRITSMEKGISVMNARNQQSIMALGVTLAAVEIIIRFLV